jgi:hypothetical protein
MTASDIEAAGVPALARLAAAAGPARKRRRTRCSRFGSGAPSGACHRARVIGRGRRQLTPALLGAG